MFCYQCQETAGGKGCTVKGVCGKENDVANLQDLLIHTLRGIALLARQSGETGAIPHDFIRESLFSTITNGNFDRNALVARITKARELRNALKKTNGAAGAQHHAVAWEAPESGYDGIATGVGVLLTDNEDIRSLRELVTYGVKGMAAYAHHAAQLGYESEAVNECIVKALAATADDTLGVDDLVALTLECGKNGVEVMALLDRANTETYGNPEITRVEIGVRGNPGILVSGHDLKDLEELLRQTAGTGIDVYTHSEMLPAHYYPAFKKYPHFAGNYGNAWWKQKEEFESFNGPILLTTNCLVPPRDTYRHRLYTTGVVGFPGVAHIPAGVGGAPKDFSALIAQARASKPPVEIETGEIVGGFAHAAVMGVAGTVVDAVKSGAIRRFYVMAGCDGRMKSRDYYAEFAKKLPADTVILTAGCAKYRYNKLGLGEIGGIPRVLDAGQCNDSYSLALIALALKDAFGLADVNDLPIAYNIAWYEQKAVIVLLALLSLGVKNIHLGPTLPAFLSPNVAGVLVNNFGIAGIGSVDEDISFF